METPLAIEIENLRVRRGKRLVLPGLSCRLTAGRVIGLLGPSGAGKTTLMRAIVGVQRITAGRVRVLGCPAGDPGLRRRLAYMTQSTSVYRDLTVGENVGYFAHLAGVDRSRAREVIDQVGLSGSARQLTGNLSGGQLARVSLACALVGDPEVLVLDEPTVSQDPVLRAELWADFRARAAGGGTLLVSSHVMDEAARCDEVVLLRDGQLVAHRSPAELLAGTGQSGFEAAFLQLVSGPRPGRAVR